MLLAIETSCDETGVALFNLEGRLIHSLLYSQVVLHSPFGGIVPEIASRKQLEVLHPLVKKLLAEAGVSPKELKVISATLGPGLIGSLLVGVTYAKTLCLTLGIPFIGVDHLSAHVFSIFLEKEVEFPFLGLLVSGGHTALFLATDFDRLELLGHTRDDAAGEAFDKVAKLLGLPYPGGPVISKLAEKGNPDYYELPRPLLTSQDFDFSFSGLKTFVLHLVKKEGEGLKVEHLCAGFERAVCEVLVEKTVKAVNKLGIPRVVVAGGVAANKRLKEFFQKRALEEGFTVHFPSTELCTDNAVMVGFLAYKKWERKEITPLSAECYARAKYKLRASSQAP